MNLLHTTLVENDFHSAVSISPTHITNFYPHHLYPDKTVIWIAGQGHPLLIEKLYEELKTWMDALEVNVASDKPGKSNSIVQPAKLDWGK
jgi:hypothetical protein